MDSVFARALSVLDEEAFQALYGRWDSLDPGQVAGLFSGSALRWWIVGGWAARAGATPRGHEDTDVAVCRTDLDELRRALSGWHLWEAYDGALRPLLPGQPLTDGCDQLWLRRDAQHPWQLDIQLDPSDEDWVFRRDPSIRVPWPRAVQVVGGIRYARPEIALLYKARQDRPKDRADLAAAVLDGDARAWLAGTLDRLGYHAWAGLARGGV
jgi:aminoglycoside-2''-adenylyltransferase